MGRLSSKYYLTRNLYYAFLSLSVDGYHDLEIFDNLLNSNYNNCFKVDDVSMYPSSGDAIAKDLKKGLVQHKDRSKSLYNLIYGYAYVCCKYHLSFSELNDLVPLKDNLDMSYVKHHIEDVCCAEHIEALYLDTIPMRWA